MVITYYGVQFIKIQLGDTVIAFNPVSKESKNKSTRFGADIAIVSANHPDFNGVENLSYGEKSPFVIAGPGEYEIGGIFISGFLSAAPYNKAGHLNTIYSVRLENMNICFLGALASPEISNETKEEIGAIDVLFVPVGGGDVLDPAVAYKTAVSLGANIIIPVHYGGVADKQLKTFLKEAGAEGTKAQDKLTIKPKDVTGKEGEVVVLKAAV